MAEEKVSIEELAEIAEIHNPNRATQDELDEARSLEKNHLRNADSISAQIKQRLSDVGSLNRAIVKVKPDIKECLEMKEEMLEDEAVYQDYIRDDPDAREYVDNLLELIKLYQELVDNFTPANMMLFPMVEQLEDVVDEQQLRHDESFVLQHTKEVVQDMKESFQDSLQSLKQSHESTNDELLNRFDRVLDRYSQVSDNQAKLQQGMTDMVALMEELADSFDSPRGKRIEQKLDRLETELTDADDSQ